MYLTTPPCPLPKRERPQPHFTAMGGLEAVPHSARSPGPCFLFFHNHSACLKHRLFTGSLKAPRSYFLQSLHTGRPLPGMLSISHPKGTPKYQCTALPDSTVYDQIASVCFRGEGIISNSVSKRIITADEILKPCYGKEFQGGNGEAPLSVYIPH